MKYLFTAFLFFVFIYSFSQISLNQLNIYPEPPTTDGVDRHNDDFTVRVKIPNGAWKDLYEYKTYVNSGPTRLENTASSFVAFDFRGTVEIEIIPNEAIVNSVLIRPQSKEIPYTLTGNTIRIQISHPQQLSVEINGDRYHNMHVFANSIETPPLNPDVTFENGVLYTFPNHRFEPNDGDVIYFKPGAIIKGNIYLDGKKDVKILGRGIIDLTFLQKHYTSNNVPEDYEYLQGVSVFRSNNIGISGLIINDPQGAGVGINKSDNININNLKMFSRVIWGDGINITASNFINIDNCFIRTADDAIPIYSTRVVEWETDYNRDATNIFVQNTSLYADAAHPIEIGFHGSQNPNNTRKIYNVKFEDINILEHDEPHSEYNGAISINCADENICKDLLFYNVNVEDFTKGKLLNIKVETGGVGAAETDGDLVRSVVFDNLTYNGYGELPSTIKGISCDRHIDGVHFSDLKVNGNFIRSLSDYNVGFETNDFVYNLTFDEADNYSTILSEGIYRIKNKQNSKYLTSLNNISQGNPLAYYVATSSLNSIAGSQNWEVKKVGGHYRIKNLSNNYFLHNSFESYDCAFSFIWSHPEAEMFVQEWKIVPNGNGYYTINNAYSRGYIQPSDLSVNGNHQAKYVINAEKTSLDNQLWRFEPLGIVALESHKSLIPEVSIKLSPIPFSNILIIENTEDINEWSLSDIYGKKIKKGYIINPTEKTYIIKTNDLTSGVYYFNAIKKDGSLFQETIIKK